MTNSDFAPLTRRSFIRIDKLFKFPIATKTERENKIENKTSEKNKANKSRKRGKNGRKLVMFKGGIVSTTG